MARTRHLTDRGVSYRELESKGLRLPVIDVHMRYRAPARYDDLVRVRCWVREVASRRVEFGYAVDLPPHDRLIATGTTALIAVNSNHVLTTLPDDVRALLVPVPDPVRL